MISCFETVTQHISGQPFCNMSMEALEMMVKHAKNLFVCRLANSGGDIDNYLREFVLTTVILTPSVGYPGSVRASLTPFRARRFAG